MNDVVPAEVLDFHRRIGATGHASSAWPFSTPLHGRGVVQPLSPGAALEGDAERVHSQGLSPVSSTPSLEEDEASPLRCPPGALRVVAIHCRFVGGGLGGAVDLCGSITLVDEHGQTLLNTVVKPTLPVTDYRTATTGLTAADVAGGMPFRRARKLVLSCLRGGALSPPRSATPGTPGPGTGAPSFKQMAVPAGHAAGAKPALLVGANLQETLSCLMLEHPEKCLRDIDTAAADRISAEASARGEQSSVNVATLLLKHFLEAH